MLTALLRTLWAFPDLLMQHPRTAAAGVLALAASSATLGHWRRRHRQASVTHGSARWATAAELRQAGFYARRGVVLGALAGHVLCDAGEAHVLVCGPTRSGKGVSHVIPTLLTWPGSALVCDPKAGENLDATWTPRSRHGDVYAFTPYARPHCRLNVLTSVRWQTPHELDDLAVLSRSLTAPEAMVHETPTSLHFRDLAAMLLDAASLHLYYAEPRKSLGGLWALLTQQHGSLQEVLTTLETTPHVAGGIHPGVKERVAALRGITGDRELSSVWTTAIRPLEPYSHPYVAASTEVSDLDLAQLQRSSRPTSLYLLGAHPLGLERLASVYRPILEVALDVGMRAPVRAWRQRLLLVGDELAWYGYLRSVNAGAAVMAGYGQKLLLVLQDLESLLRVYGAHNSLWGNTAIKVFHTPTDDLTAKRISDNMTGRRTVQGHGESQAQRWGAVRTVSTHETGRALLMPDEVMNLMGTQVLIRAQGLRPILAQKTDYRTWRRRAA